MHSVDEYFYGIYSRHLLFILVLMRLVAPVTSQCTVGIDRFRRYSVPENMAVTDHMTGDSMFSPVAEICLLKCTEDKKCLGMVYDVIEKRCFLKECVNPHLFTKWNGRNEDYYISISQRANKSPNKLLARGDKNCIPQIIYLLSNKNN